MNLNNEGQIDLPTELWQVYKATHYKVYGHETFTLKIGEQSPTLLQLFDQTNALCAAYITAYNPFSQQLPASKNEAQQAALKAELMKRGLKFVDGIGQHPNGQWPGEPSVLILDLDMAAATTLARHYEQNAIVWCGRDGVPQLVAT